MDKLVNSNIHKQTKELRRMRRHVHRAINQPPQPPPPPSHRGGNWASPAYQYRSGSYYGGQQY
eukprot:1242667-Prorocentrum_lima.AAC.1